MGKSLRRAEARRLRILIAMVFYGRAAQAAVFSLLPTAA